MALSSSYEALVSAYDRQDMVRDDVGWPPRGIDVEVGRQKAMRVENATWVSNAMCGRM